MTETFNGCSYSEIWASPSNWATTTAKSALNKDWYVQCQFYDPRFKHKYPRGFQFRKRLNKIKTLDQRKDAVKFLLENIPALLEVEGFNPISKEYMAKSQPEHVTMEINGDMPLCDALELALSMTNYERHTKNDIVTVIKYFLRSAVETGYDAKPVNKIIAIHVDLIMDNLVKNIKPLTDKRYNRYLAYLSRLFSLLKKKGIIPYNILDDYEKKKTIVEPRKTLTVAERIKINNYLQMNHTRFWLFCIIFFHSGGREIELLRLKYEDIDLDNLYYRTLVKKGGQNKIVFRPIKKISVPFWEKAMINAKMGDYIFSVGLVPGPSPIRRDQITRRWRVHVKQKLNIEADFYSMKHSNLTEISQRASAKEAARAAGHTSTAMIRKHYDTDIVNREMNTVRAMTNEFAPVRSHKTENEFCAPVSFKFTG